MRTLPAALLTAFGYAVQKPAYLLYIGWSSSPMYFSSFDTVTFLGQPWLRGGFDVGGVQMSEVTVSGSLKMDNADDLLSSYILGEGVSDKTIRIYGYDASSVSGGVLADTDAVLMIECVGGKAVIGKERVTITLRNSPAFAYTPRQYVKPPTFTNLIPAGTRLTINGQDYEIKR
jgi:hypothetical protein